MLIKLPETAEQLDKLLMPEQLRGLPVLEALLQVKNAEVLQLTVAENASGLLDAILNATHTEEPLPVSKINLLNDMGSRIMAVTNLLPSGPSKKEVFTRLNGVIERIGTLLAERRDEPEVETPTGAGATSSYVEGLLKENGAL